MVENVIKPLANAICIACAGHSEDNQLRTSDLNISYGTIIANDLECMYIAVVNIDDGDILYNINMPIVAYNKCRLEIQSELESILKDT